MTLEKLWPMIAFVALLFIVEGAVRYYFNPILERRGWQYLERWLRLTIGGILVWMLDLNVFALVREAFGFTAILTNASEERIQMVGVILTAVLIGLGSQGTALIVAQVRGVWTKYLKDLPATLKNGLNGSKDANGDE